MKRFACLKCGRMLEYPDGGAVREEGGYRCDKGHVLLRVSRSPVGTAVVAFVGLTFSGLFTAVLLHLMFGLSRHVVYGVPIDIAIVLAALLALSGLRMVVQSARKLRSPLGPWYRQLVGVGLAELASAAFLALVALALLRVAPA